MKTTHILFPAIVVLAATLSSSATPSDSSGHAEEFLGIPFGTPVTNLKAQPLDVDKTHVEWYSLEDVPDPMTFPNSDTYYTTVLDFLSIAGVQVTEKQLIAIRNYAVGNPKEINHNNGIQLSSFWSYSVAATPQSYRVHTVLACLSNPNIVFLSVLDSLAHAGIDLDLQQYQSMYDYASGNLKGFINGPDGFNRTLLDIAASIRNNPAWQELVGESAKRILRSLPEQSGVRILIDLYEQKQIPYWTFYSGNRLLLEFPPLPAVSVNERSILVLATDIDLLKKAEQEANGNVAWSAVPKTENRQPGNHNGAMFFPVGLNPYYPRVNLGPVVGNFPSTQPTVARSPSPLLDGFRPVTGENGYTPGQEFKSYEDYLKSLEFHKNGPRPIGYNGDNIPVYDRMPNFETIPGAFIVPIMYSLGPAGNTTEYVLIPAKGAERDAVLREIQKRDAAFKQVGNNLQAFRDANQQQIQRINSEREEIDSIYRKDREQMADLQEQKEKKAERITRGLYGAPTFGTTPNGLKVTDSPEHAAATGAILLPTKDFRKGFESGAWK